MLKPEAPPGNATPREIEVADIERELTRLWREAAKPSGHDQQPYVPAPAVIRACALNLVVAGCGGQQQDLAPLLSAVTEAHPCRALVILTDGQSSETPRAWVNMVCHRGGRGQPRVCSEQVILTAAPAALHELVASVAGLLVADLPTFLWWRGRPPQPGPEEERFDHLADVADRILLDSALYDSAQLAAASALARQYRRIPFGDLNWARLTPWRAAVAQCFDPPAMQALLPGLTRARIYHASSEAPAAVRLMAGWLRSRLGQFLAVDFAAGQADLLELHAAEACFRVARPGELTEAMALSEELRLLGRDRVFDQALEAALEIR